MASVARAPRTAPRSAGRPRGASGPPRRSAVGCRGLDLGVLWGDLSVGLLVMVTGALLVPALGLGRALLAIVVGTALGCIPLALVALAGQREGVPTMVLLRPVLGARGSFVPSAFERRAARRVDRGRVLGDGRGRQRRLQAAVRLRRPAPVWVAVVAVLCTALALGGPILVVRRWLERFGIYVLLGYGGVDHVRGAPRRRPRRDLAGAGRGRAAVLARGRPRDRDADLVASARGRLHAGSPSRVAGASPARTRATWPGTCGSTRSARSWSLVGRGERRRRSGSATRSSTSPAAASSSSRCSSGESDNAFADIYSAAVSTQNVTPNVPQRALIAAVGAVGFLLALVFTMERYELFLLLIGSVFVPLFGGVRSPTTSCDRGAATARARCSSGRGVRWLRLRAVGRRVPRLSLERPDRAPGMGGRGPTVLFDWLSLPFPLFGSGWGEHPELRRRFGARARAAVPRRAALLGDRAPRAAGARDEEDHGRALRRVRDRELGPRRHQGRLPLLQALARPVDLDDHLAGHDQDDRVGVRVGDRAERLVAAPGTRPRTTGARSRTAARGAGPSSRNRTRSRRSFASMAAAYGRPAAYRPPAPGG